MHNMKRAGFVGIAGLLALGCAKSSVTQAKGIVFSIYPAVEGSVGQKDCRDFFGRCMIFQTEKPVMEISGFGFKPVPRPSPLVHNRIEISLDQSQSDALREITKQYGGEGKNLAIVYNNKIVHAPKIRGEIVTSNVVLDFCNPHLYDIMLATLRGEIPPNYDFTKDKGCDACVGPSEAKDVSETGGGNASR